MTDFTLTNCRLLDPFGPARFVEHGYISIKDGLIAATGSGHPEPGTEHTHDLQGDLVLPGLINAHTHLYSALALGMPGPEQAPVSFQETLERVWWRLDRALDDQSTKASFEAGLLACLRAGVTTVIDHHSSQSFVRGSLDMLADAAESMGINIAVAFEASDRNGSETLEAALEENATTIQKWGKHPQVKPLFGLHASFTLSDESLQKVQNLLQQFPGVGIHIHLSEGPEDGVDAINRGYRSPVDRLDRFGLLTEHSIVVHGVHCDAADRKLLADRDVILVHNPSSNANNRVGLPSPELLDTCSAGLGTDGMQADMLREAKEGTLIWSKSRRAGESVPDMLEMLLRNNAQIASRLFNRPIGHIASGHAADLAIYAYDSRTPLTAGNAGSQLLFGLDQRPRHVISQGQFRIRDGQAIGIDEEAILQNSRTQASRLWQAMKSL